MNIIQRFFKKLVGKPVDEYPVSDEENRRRAFVTTANLDWRGLPIDRDRGAGMLPPKGYRKLVDDYLERAGLHIERRKPPAGIQAVSDLGTISDMFERERQADARWRRPPADAWLREGDAYSKSSASTPIGLG
jgi:hypothetical protein